MILTLLTTVIMNFGALQMDEQSYIEYMADMEEYCSVKRNKYQQ